ncbi:MAG: 6-phosphogluconolactonase [Nitrospira sp.]|nr:6-phosphogluconolactonase [Nitrospira sp.]
MSSSQQDIRIYPTTAALMEAAARHFVQQARQAIETRDTLTLALAGGSTPKSLYALLAAPPFRTQLDWTRVHFFWGDERHVPPDHQDSNYRMARESLLNYLPVAPDHIHRVPSEIPDARTAADRYEDMIRRHFDVLAPGVPRFDCVLLGMGPDGHTASLFPGTQAAHEQHRLVAAPWVDTLQTSRITCTPALLNHARHVTFLVQGQHKAHMLRSALEGPLQPDLCPASSIRPQSGTLTWFVDQEAASELSRPS